MIDLNKKQHLKNLVTIALADAVLMAVIDGEIHEKEVEYIREMGAILNFPDNYIDHIIRRSYELWNKSE